MPKQAEVSQSRAATLPLVGGALALDFCNTASGRGTPDLQDHVTSLGFLLAWARHANAIDEITEARLQRCGEDDPVFAERLLARALTLRDATYRLDAALAQGAEPNQRDIDTVAETHAACLSQGLFTSRGGTFGWTWSIAEAPEAILLGPLAASAMEVIATADRARLRQCRGYHCGWLFFDTSKNNRRAWCEMEVCGNRAKQRRHRKREQDMP